jgi:hypothetical protein
MRIIDFDFVHSRAIVRELARDTTLAAETRVGTTRKLKMQIDRLHKLEEQSPSIVPDMEH